VSWARGLAKGSNSKVLKNVETNLKEKGE